MEVLNFLTKMNRQEKGLNDRVTAVAKDFMRAFIYKFRKENGVIIPRIRISVWLLRENGETMMTEHEIQLNAKGLEEFEEVFQSSEKKKK